MYPVQIMRTIFIRIAAGILVASACTSCAGQADVSTEAGWIWLFDGSDLDAWREFNKSTVMSPAWVIEGNELALRPERKTSRKSVSLVSKKQYADFELELDWKLTPGGNSGIFFHVVEHPELIRPSQSGIEMQILDDHRHKDGKDPTRRAGSVYALYAPTRAMTKPVGEWNSVRIRTVGGQVEYWLNGVQVAAFDRDSDDWGERVVASKFTRFKFFDTQRYGYLALQDHADTVFFRNIRIREL